MQRPTVSAVRASLTIASDHRNPSATLLEPPEPPEVQPATGTPVPRGDEVAGEETAQVGGDGLVRLDEEVDDGQADQDPDERLHLDRDRPEHPIREDDPVRGSVAAILKALIKTYKSKPFKAKNIDKNLSDFTVRRFDDLRAAWGEAVDLKFSKNPSMLIGNWLRDHKGQVVDGIKIMEVRKDRTGAKIWQVKKIKK